jgi:hypothetical protein
MGNAGQEVAALARLAVKELLVKYGELLGEVPASRNRTWLIKKVSWRLQARAEGGLTERALKRARELADDADLRINPPRKSGPGSDGTSLIEVDAPRSDGRLPPPGTVLTRPYKGGVVQVRVLPDGFEYEGAVYTSLSAVARKITGSHCNGYLFFRLPGKRGGA